MDRLAAELHCHNVFSNFHQSGFDTPFDCGIGIGEQLDRAARAGLDCLFVTNHNTTDGYAQLLEYKRDHPRYDSVRVYPAEEITTDEGAHVIAYGIRDAIRPGLTFGETLDEIARQDAVSSAPHPFGLLDALRERSGSCDLIEVFNSNNIDVIANLRATEFARQRGITGVCGSDSHVLSTLGRCTNVIESENSLDDILHSMRHGRVSIRTTGYASADETLEHFRYKVENSKEYISEYVSRFYPRSRRLFSLLLRLFEYSPDSHLWLLLFRIGAYAMRRVSAKVNYRGMDPGFMRERDLMTMLRASL